jgi:outer membrane protein assembly factor BamB
MSTQHTNPIDAIQTPRPDAEVSMAATPRWMPGLVCVALYWVVIQSLKLFAESNYLIFMATFVGPMITALLFFVTWLGFSRRPWSERGFGMLMFVVTGALAGWLAHSTMKFGLILYGLPTLLTMWSVWSWVTRLTASLGSRRVTLALTMLVSASYYCLLRLDGITGAMDSELSWRWSPTAEEKFLATAKRSTEKLIASAESASAEIAAQPGDWIGFRGPNRDGIVSFGFQAQHEPLQVRVAVWAFGWQQDCFYLSTGFQEIAKS